MWWLGEGGGRMSCDGGRCSVDVWDTGLGRRFERRAAVSKQRGLLGVRRRAWRGLSAFSSRRAKRVRCGRTARGACANVKSLMIMALFFIFAVWGWWGELSLFRSGRRYRRLAFVSVLYAHRNTMEVAICEEPQNTQPRSA
jgi:hypothetical protein